MFLVFSSVVLRGSILYGMSMMVFSSFFISFSLVFISWVFFMVISFRIEIEMFKLEK